MAFAFSITPDQVNHSYRHILSSCNSLPINHHSGSTSLEAPMDISVSCGKKEVRCIHSDSIPSSTLTPPPFSSSSTPDNTDDDACSSPQTTASPLFSNENIQLLLNISSNRNSIPPPTFLSPSPSPSYPSSSSSSTRTHSSFFTPPSADEEKVKIRQSFTLSTSAALTNSPPRLSSEHLPELSSSSVPSSKSTSPPSSSNRRKSSWPISASIIARLPGIIFTLDEPKCPHMPRFLFPYDPEVDSEDDMDFYCSVCASNQDLLCTEQLNEMKSSSATSISSLHTTSNDNSKENTCFSPDQTLSSPPFSRCSSPFSDILTSSTELSLSQDSFSSLQKEENETALSELSDASSSNLILSHAKNSQSFLGPNEEIDKDNSSRSTSLNIPFTVDSRDGNMDQSSNTTARILTPPLTPMAFHLHDPNFTPSASFTFVHTDNPSEDSGSLEVLDVSMEEPKDLITRKKSKVSSVPSPQKTQTSFSHFKSSKSHRKKIHTTKKTKSSKKSKVFFSELCSESIPFERQQRLVLSHSKETRSTSMNKNVSLPSRKKASGLSPSNRIITSKRAAASIHSLPTSTYSSWLSNSNPHTQDYFSRSSSVRSALPSSSPTGFRTSSPDILSKDSISFSTTTSHSASLDYAPSGSMFQHLCYSCQNDFLSTVPNTCPRSTRAQRQQKHSKPDLCPVCTDLFRRHGLRCTACYFVPAENVVDSGQVKCERCFGGTYTCDRL